MKNQGIRVVHYLNQFFGGIGGEEKADVGLEVLERPVGPGLGLQQAMGDEGQIIATLVCGDNHFSSQTEAVLDAALYAIESFHPDVVIAGPAFNAGRYGFACGELSKAVAEKLRTPAVTAMYTENPAAETYRRIPGVWILPTGMSAADMRNVLPRLAAFALKRGRHEPIGPARVGDYIPSGRRNLEVSTIPGADRALAMLLAKLAGEPFQTEIPIAVFEQTSPAPPVTDLKTIRLGLVTTSGLVPKGNPDKFRVFNATHWNKYRLPVETGLLGTEWEVIHGGFNTVYAQANPNLVLPLDTLRELEGRAYGELDDHFYSITGVGTSLTVAKSAGEEIASALRDAEVGAALLVAT